MLDSLHSLPLHNALYSLQSSRGDIRSTLQWKDRHLVIGLCHCWTLPGLAAVPWGLWIRSGQNCISSFLFFFLCTMRHRQATAHVLSPSGENWQAYNSLFFSFSPFFHFSSLIFSNPSGYFTFPGFSFLPSLPLPYLTFLGCVLQWCVTHEIILHVSCFA